MKGKSLFYGSFLCGFCAILGLIVDQTLFQLWTGILMGLILFWVGILIGHLSE